MSPAHLIPSGRPNRMRPKVEGGSILGCEHLDARAWRIGHAIVTGVAVTGSQQLQVLDAEAFEQVWGYGTWNGFLKAWTGLTAVSEGKGYPLPARPPMKKLAPWAPKGAVVGDAKLNVRWWHWDGIVITGLANPKTCRLLVQPTDWLGVIWSSSAANTFEQAWSQLRAVVATGGFKMPISILA